MDSAVPSNSIIPRLRTGRGTSPTVSSTTKAFSNSAKLEAFCGSSTRWPEVRVREPLTVEYFVRMHPVQGWRRWEITPSRVSDQKSGTLLRGALGQVWNGPRATAKCLYMRHPGRPLLGAVGGDGVAGRHSSPAPDPACRCGIHAMKVGADAEYESPWQPLFPSVAGFVQLTGAVIEGERGFRGQAATMVGPLEMDVPCAGERCDNPADSVATRGGRYLGLCPRHRATSSGVETLDSWLTWVVTSLERRYVSPIVF